jgi:hypothetical protein
VRPRRIAATYDRLRVCAVTPGSYRRQPKYRFADSAFAYGGFFLAIDFGKRLSQNLIEVASRLQVLLQCFPFTGVLGFEFFGVAALFDLFAKEFT